MEIKNKNFDIKTIVDLPENWSIEISLGLQNIEKNSDLNKIYDELNPDGTKKTTLDILYQYSATSSYNGYINTFKKAQQVKKNQGIKNIDYGVIYLKNDKQEIISMIAGPIDKEKGKFTILNTGTLESERGKKRMKKLLRGAPFKLKEQGFNIIDVFIDTDIPKNEGQNLSNKKLDKNIVMNKIKELVGDNLSKVFEKNDYFGEINKENEEKWLNLVDKISNGIENVIQENEKKKKINNFIVANNILGKTPFMTVELDDEDKRFIDYYIKPKLEITDKNLKEIEKDKNACIIF